ncbi:RNA polymerase subunit sigma [Bacillus sp. FJAT-29814]|uniref:RNA polymerase subunit sigma n=1 Tax=Bacillus sp. FJAT-29814 TaxID=1729688 RepID=UPI000ADCF25F|nr:RNA polymerase subunit sigma [Bacillus sp. FJAT-29814]
MVNLRYGYVEFFMTEDKSNTSTKDPNVKINDDNIASICPFTLTHSEEKAYGSFQNDLNLMRLEGLGPISIAKLYVKAGFDKKYNVQYALYTDRPEYVQWSKEEDEKIPASDRGTNEQNHIRFKNIDMGRFLQKSDYEGYIEHDSSDSSEAKSGFQMIKNENGVWQIAFSPIQ